MSEIPDAPEFVIEVAIGLYDGPQTGADTPPRMAVAVLAALAEHGLVVVARQDLAETLNDAHAYDVEYRIDLDRPSAGARLDRLRAALTAGSGDR